MVCLDVTPSPSEIPVVHSQDRILTGSGVWCIFGGLWIFDDQPLTVCNPTLTLCIPSVILCKGDTDASKGFLGFFDTPSNFPFYRFPAKITE